MRSSRHLVINFAAGGILLYLLGYEIISYQLLAIVLFGVVVDVDHLFNQMWKGNLFHPEKMVQEWDAIADRHSGELYLFHSYEFMGLIGLAGFLHPIFFFAFIGLAMHFVSDAVGNFNESHTFAWLEDYSICYYLYRMRDFPVVEKFLKHLLNIMNPKSFFKLLVVYLLYLYTHPETMMGWILTKPYPTSVLRWLADKI